MRRHLLPILTALFGVLLVDLSTGCSVLLPETKLETAQQRAAEQRQHSCGGIPGDLDARLAAPGMIQRVEPLHTVRQSRGNAESRLLGAQLRLWALPGLTTEWLERALKCHSARQTLAQLPATLKDPYWLPDGWVDIAVRSDEGGFLVSLRGEDPARSGRILERARAFTTPEVVTQNP